MPSDAERTPTRQDTRASHWLGPPPPDPLFSVVVPAYMARSTIYSAVESVLRNDAPLEIIVVEDGSPDPVQPGDLPPGPVCLLGKERNGGTARARNAGILQARGRWIAFLDADDIYEPHRLDAAQSFLAAGGDLDGLVTDCLIVSPNGDTRVSAPTPNSEGLMHLRTGTIGAVQILSRNLFETIGLFDPRWRINEDYDLWLRMLISGARIGYLPRPAYVYRLNPDGKTSTLSSSHLKEFRDILLSNALRPGVPPTTRGLLVARALRWPIRVSLARRWRELIPRFPSARDSRQGPGNSGTAPDEG